MSPRIRFYCQRCRRSLSPKAFDAELWEEVSFQICKVCVSQLEAIGIDMTVSPTVKVETEKMIQVILWEREGGEREVETPVGYVDLVTDDEVIEIKHVKSWREGLKVLLFRPYFAKRGLRLHLFGGHTKEFRSLVNGAIEPLGVKVTWEQEPYNSEPN